MLKLSALDHVQGFFVKMTTVEETSVKKNKMQESLSSSFGNLNVVCFVRRANFSLIYFSKQKPIE